MTICLALAARLTASSCNRWHAQLRSIPIAVDRSQCRAQHSAQLFGMSSLKKSQTSLDFIVLQSPVLLLKHFMAHFTKQGALTRTAVVALHDTGLSAD